MDYSRYRHLPNALRKHRKALGLTQKDVGEQLHIDPDWISHWENGDCLPSLVSAMRLADFYGTPPEELFVGLVEMARDSKDKKG